jgi:RecJ-like exonuclease
MSDDHNYVLKQVVTYKRVKIPDGSVKCPFCKGTGKIRIKYSEPPSNTQGDFWSCIRCGGKGFTSEDELHEDEALDMLIQERMAKEKK